MTREEETITRLREFIILHQEQHGWDVSTIKALKKAIKALEFVEWVADEIFSADWKYNKGSFEELACRKLEKMGIVRETGTDWELVESIKAKKESGNMTLDEAIKREEEAAEKNAREKERYNRGFNNTSNNYKRFEEACKREEEHKLLAEWLKDYKQLKEQEPKTGHWIGRKEIGYRKWKDCIVPLKDGFVTDSCSCSECGEWLTASDEYLCYGNYCPYCGAKMESEG